MKDASSIALNILVDVLDHFIDSFCRLFKNLRQIHQFSLTDNQTSSPLSFTNDFYSSQVSFIVNKNCILFYPHTLQ